MPWCLHRFCRSPDSILPGKVALAFPLAQEQKETRQRAYGKPVRKREEKKKTPKSHQNISISYFWVIFFFSFQWIGISSPKRVGPRQFLYVYPGVHEGANCLSFLLLSLPLPGESKLGAAREAQYRWTGGRLSWPRHPRAMGTNKQVDDWNSDGIVVIEFVSQLLISQELAKVIPKPCAKQSSKCSLGKK